MAATFKSNDTSIADILRQIDSGSVQLPDFQRGWVWDDHRIRALIASIMSSYPVGALMFLEYGGDTVRFRRRLFTGATKDATPDVLVLDGQQRLTSIYNAMYCSTAVPTRTDKGQPIERYYYLDIEKCLDGVTDTVDAILSIPEDRMLKSNFGRRVDLDLSTREREYAELMFPLNIVFDAPSWIEWTNGCKQYHGYSNAEAMQLIDTFTSQVLVSIQMYKVPVISLDKDTPKEAVCQVFENVNTGGVSLTVFELVTASFAADDFGLREDWEGDEKKGSVGRRGRMRKASRLLSGVSATDFLQAITLVSRYWQWSAGGPAVSCKKKDVLSLELDEYKRYADLVEDGFVRAAHFLGEQRIFSTRDIPYTTQLVPLSAIYAILGNKAHDSVVRKKISRWYWCGVMGEMYGGANETRYANDVTGVVAWADGSEDEPDTVARSYFQPMRLLTLQTRLSAAYKGVMALILKHGARDFMSGKPMDFTFYDEESVDIHHIFPQDYCQKQSLPRRRWNSVVNKTPVSSRTNRVVKGAAPSAYAQKIIEDGHVNSGDFDRYMATHVVDVGLLRADDFDGYFVERAKGLINLIADAMGKPVSNLDGEDVVEGFGATLGDR
ncbi:MAG: DUF262 domain-containing protein [Coriobacteriales bacterium]|nr:DUF262 domain-containing protein [Coriobacteriales bacterium]